MDEIDRAERVAWRGLGVLVVCSVIGFVLGATAAPGAVNVGLGVGIAAVMLFIVLLIVRRTDPRR